MSVGLLVGEEGEEAEGVVGAASGAILGAGAVRSEKADGDLISGGEGDGAEGGGEFAGEVEFVVVGVRFAAPVHGFGGVDENVNGEVFFFFKEFDEGFFEPGVHVPVEVTEVVAGDVVAVVGKLDADTALFRAAVAFHRPRADFVRHEGEGVEFAEGGFVEEHEGGLNM